MKHKTNVCVTRRTTRQVSLCLNSIAVGGPIRHLTFVLEHNAGDEYMVLQILAHAGQVLNDVNSKAAQRLRLPNAREHQKLRAIDGARGEDHFLVCRDILVGAIIVDCDADTTSAFEVQFHHVGVEQQSEVRPRQCWAEEGTNGAHTSPIRGDVHVDVAGASAHRSVHVIQNGHANLASSVDEDGRCRMRVFGPADVYWAANAAPGVGATLPILLTLEDWKHVGEGPTLGSVLRPPVVVPFHAAYPYHGVDAGAAAKYVAKGHVEFAIVQSRRWVDG